jgi:hypothetical protein
MSTLPATVDAFESALIQGDLSKLTAQERSSYYLKVCESLGLNHLTQPFAYITLNNKLTLYVKRDATEQLRRKHKVSVTISSRELVGDVYVVTARATMPDGRTDESVGAVSVAGKKGDDLANCYMRAETKSKRRVTLSIVGLGWLEESELDSISSNVIQSEGHAPALPAPEQTKKPANGKPAPLPADGAELESRLQDYEKKLVAEGLCGPGELMAHLHLMSERAKLPEEMDRWPVEVFAETIEEARLFQKKRREERTLGKEAVK